MRPWPSRSLPRDRDLPGLLTLLPGDEKHQPSALSTLDVIWVLYDRVLRVDPAQARKEKRDEVLCLRDSRQYDRRGRLVPRLRRRTLS